MIKNIKFFPLFFILFACSIYAKNLPRTYSEAAYCFDSHENNYVGLYSLDYLLTRKLIYDENYNYTEEGDWEQILTRLKEILDEKYPKFAVSLEEFIDAVGNHTDHNKKFIWEKFDVSVFQLSDFNNSSFIREIPYNCYFGGTQNGPTGDALIQIIDFKELPSGKVLYRYNEERFNFLKNHRPIQLSYILTNEWLWIFFPDASYYNNVRRINKLLHSENLIDLSPERFQLLMNEFELDINQ